MLCDPFSGDLIDRANEIMNRIDDNMQDRYSYELILSEIGFSNNTGIFFFKKLTVCFSWS